MDNLPAQFREFKLLDKPVKIKNNVMIQYITVKLAYLAGIL